MKELPLWKVVNKKESLDGARQVEFDHSVREISAGDLKDYDLFLYKMKDRELFYQREHYKNISPESFTFENYWNDFWKKCLEGEWINDKGTWVYFMPKLFYYVNYVKIIGNKEGDEDSRIEMSPDLSSLEWLQYSYLLLCDGFSGFEEDDIYTCNKLVWRLANGFSINKYQRKKLENCYQPNGELKIYVDPWEYLTRFYLVDNPSDKPLGKALYENSRENGIFMGSRGCHGKGTEVRMYDGSTKKIEDVVKGDVMMGDDGTPRVVQATVSGIDHMYKVIQSHGEDYVCNSDHKLVLDTKKLKRQGKGEPRKPYVEKEIVTVEEYFNMQNNSERLTQKYSTVDSGLIQYPEKEHILHPYWMGLWIGDGFKGRKRICGGVSDTETLDWLLSYVASDDKMSCNVYEEDGGVGENTWRFDLTHDDLLLKNNWWNLNFNPKGVPTDKYIHQDYLIDSEENRLELLAGIIDSDGSWDEDRKRHRITTSNLELSRQYVELCKSLGFKVRVCETKSSGKSFNPNSTIYVVSIWGDHSRIPNRITRKKSNHIYNPKGKGKNRKKLEIEYLGIGEYFGVHLNDNHLYLLKDYTVTHNTAKSYCLYGGDLLHEWTFGGVRTFEERHKCSTRLLFAAGSGDSEPLERSLKIIDGFYDNQPGQFKYPNPDRPKYQGPFYKRVQGNWTSGVAHIVKNKQNKKTLTGSTLQVSVITPDRKKIGAGDRFRRLYVEECGFVGYLDQVHSANKDSTEIGKNKVGSSMYSGTSGDIHDVIGSKKLFENPGAYTIASIPNYWKNSDLSIGLFLSAIYKYREYKDPQGNNDLITALELLNEERKNNSEKMDSSAFDDYIMYAPIHPDEMLRPNRRAFLPVAQAQARLSDIDAYDYFNIHANLGDLRYNSGEKYGVEFRKDNEGKTRPIKEYNIDRSKIDLAGCYTIFEQPPEEIPEGLYWVVYDPVAKPGQGQSLDASLNVAVVYKYFYTGGEDTLEDSIVAEWVGREDDLYANYERVVKLAKYYNAKIFPETNTAGFVTWCYENGHGQLLQEEAYLAERELNPNYRKKGAVGFTITGDRKKPWLLQKLKSWLLYKRGHNKDTGDFHSYNIEHILSTRFLDEIVNFNEAAGNFDYISAMLGLMLLINQLDKEAVELVQPKEEQEIYYEKNINYVRRRSSFETY